MKTQIDLYQQVTDRVIDMMKTHGTNWVNPFNKTAFDLMPRNATTKKAYRGINIPLLAFTPFANPYWAGFHQWKAKGCHVRKGEKGTSIIYFSVIQRDKKDANGAKTGDKESFPMIRSLYVWNATQVEGDFAASLSAADATVPDATSVIAEADRVLLGTGANITHQKQGTAFYRPADDRVYLPHRNLFNATPTSTATECYYSTLAHELVHWTGHPSREARDFSGRFGDKAYAFEELVAELGAAFLCAMLNISPEPRADHAHYLNHWMGVLKDDKRAFVKAATLAQAAARRICPDTIAEESVADAA